MKELEKLCQKEKGITSMSVKEILQGLVDDGMVDTDKIGTSVYFWAFPSKAGQNVNAYLSTEINCCKSCDDVMCILQQCDIKQLIEFSFCHTENLKLLIFVSHCIFLAMVHLRADIIGGDHL